MECAWSYEKKGVQKSRSQTINDMCHFQLCEFRLILRHATPSSPPHTLLTRATTFSQHSSSCLTLKTTLPLHKTSLPSKAPMPRAWRSQLSSCANEFDTGGALGGSVFLGGDGSTAASSVGRPPLSSNVCPDCDTMCPPFPQNRRHTSQTQVRSERAATVDCLQECRPFTTLLPVHLQSWTFILPIFSHILALFIT